MRAVLLLCLGVFTLSGCGRPAAAPQHAPPNDSIHGDIKQVVELREGRFTIPNRSFLCEVVKGRIVCDNGRVAVECDAETCTAYHFSQKKGPTLPLPEAKAPATRLLPAKTLVDTGFVTCWVEATYIECHLVGYLGGFAMSDQFVRNSSFDDAPPGWPWDGRAYTNADRPPGV